MAHQVGPLGQVYSFEPSDLARAVLEQTVELNDCSKRVQVRSEVLNATGGSAEFYLTGDAGSNANSLIPIERAERKTKVITTTLD